MVWRGVLLGSGECVKCGVYVGEGARVNSTTLVHLRRYVGCFPIFLFTANVRVCPARVVIFQELSACVSVKTCPSVRPSQLTMLPQMVTCSSKNNDIQTVVFEDSIGALRSGTHARDSIMRW